MTTLRTALAVALLTLVSGVAMAATKQPADAACAAHVKKMQGMKTSAERTAYCKADEECSSHHCAKMVSHHHAKTKAGTAAPKAEPKS
jgi:hypothetical protein